MHHRAQVSPLAGASSTTSSSIGPYVKNRNQARTTPGRNGNLAKANEELMQPCAAFQSSATIDEKCNANIERLRGIGMGRSKGMGYGKRSGNLNFAIKFQKMNKKYNTLQSSVK